jgi:hypothetical protein
VKRCLERRKQYRYLIKSLTMLVPLLNGLSFILGAFLILIGLGLLILRPNEEADLRRKAKLCALKSKECDLTSKDIARDPGVLVLQRCSCQTATLRSSSSSLWLVSCASWFSSSRSLSICGESTGSFAFGGASKVLRYGAVSSSFWRLAGCSENSTPQIFVKRTSEPRKAFWKSIS